MSEFDAWRAELKGARRDGLRWVPGRARPRLAPLLASGALLAAGLLALALLRAG